MIKKTIEINDKEGTMVLSNGIGRSFTIRFKKKRNRRYLEGIIDMKTIKQMAEVFGIALKKDKTYKELAKEIFGGKLVIRK